MNDNAPARCVLDFWFGEPGSPGYGQARTEWFRKNDWFDAEIARRFGPMIEQALGGELREWENDAWSALARILLLDQFPRNVFRNIPRAFAGDTLALDAARAMVATGQDEVLLSVQRGFAYMPYEHSEHLRDQDESVRLYTKLATVAPETSDMLDYAHRHRAVIARFGRFAHRNAVLGRASSVEELAFLQAPGSRF